MHQVTPLFHPYQGLGLQGFWASKGAKARVAALEQVLLSHEHVKLLFQTVRQQAIKRGLAQIPLGDVFSMIPSSSSVPGR